MQESEKQVAKDREAVEDEDDEDIELTPGTSYMLDSKLVIEMADNFEADAAVNGGHDGEDRAVDVDGMEGDNFDEPELKHNDEN
jgi:hypothetical protein